MTGPGEPEAGPPPGPRWRLAVPQLGAVVAGLLIGAGGAVAGRGDVVMLGLPLLAWAAWSWDRRPHTDDDRPATDASRSAPLEVRLTGDRAPVGGAVPYRLRIDAPAGVESVQLRTLALGVHPRLFVLAARPGHPIELEGTVPAPHSGPQRLITVDWRLVSTGGALATDVAPGMHIDRVLDPVFSPIAALPLPRRLTGLTGSHDSARPGDGGDFHDIDRFRPGDRLRRIDWKATARLAREPGELYVRRTRAQADATVFVVIDSGDDLGENVDQWTVFSPLTSGVTSLDLARSAASAIAAGFVRAGDRVAFADLGLPGRLVPPGAGSRHLSRVLRAVAATRPVGATRMSRRPPLVTQGAGVFLLSTLLDDQSSHAALQLAAAGHRVIAIDVLPTPYLAGLSPERRIAHRLVMMERADRLTELAAGGVDVLRWGEARHDADRDAALLALARPPRTGTAAPR